MASAIESSSITPDAQLNFRNRVSLTLGYSELDQSSLSNGNNTQLVRTSLNFTSTDALTCLEQRGQRTAS